MDEITLGAIFGLFLPIIISFLKGRDWPTWASLALTLVICLVAGGAAAVVEGSLTLTGGVFHDPEELFAGAAAAFTAASVVYKTYFKKTPLNETLTGS